MCTLRYTISVNQLAWLVVVIVSIFTILRGSEAQSDMTKFEAIIFALSMTPFPHEVWSPASSEIFGIRTHDPHTRGRAL